MIVNLFRRSKLFHLHSSRFSLSTIVTLSLVLMFVSACGKKAPVTDTAVELQPAPPMMLEPAQQERIDNWHKLMKEKQHAPVLEKLISVNMFFNRLVFVDDSIHWGKEDYWSTPLEFLISNGGDCEDFATAKYFTLLNMQVPDEKMRLIYVKSMTLQKPHMVLGYYSVPSADPLVLDSIIDDIQPASKRKDLFPVYSFNGEGLWLAKQQSSDRVGGSDRLSLWEELLKRYQSEAIAGEVSEKTK
jgi:predicted transglutaminase-like cysteine proteinase